MLSKSEKKFAIVFSLFVLAELISGNTRLLSSIHYFAKPAIVVSLLYFFWKKSKNLHHVLRYTVVLALVFSLSGDILLMFVEQSPNFFLLGLVAFLLAHIMYIIAFWRDRMANKGVLGFIILLLGYAFGLFYLLKDGLKDMMIPVIIYMIVILSMSTTAFLRRGNVPVASYWFVFVGAILFMVSDSILALNKFYQTLPLSSISIMLTYALAQFCIIIGLLKSDSLQQEERS